MRARVATLATLTLGLALACGGDRSTEAPNNGTETRTPAETFSALERRLLAADTVLLAFDVTAEGAMEVDIHGQLGVTPEGGIRMTGSGSIAGNPVALSLRTADGTYMFGMEPQLTSATTPVELKEALMIGLTRMGILHNLAMLSSSAPPDHADGGVQEWVTVGDFSAGPESDSTLAFALAVEGQPSGTATLTLDGQGLPIVRTQTVQFSNGEMRVTERYGSVVISGH